MIYDKYVYLLKPHCVPLLSNNSSYIGLKSLFLAISITVRKHPKAETIEQQVKLLTTNIFEDIFASEKNIRTFLLDEGGFIYPLTYPGHKWKITEGGTKNIFLSHCASTLLKQIFTSSVHDWLY